MSIRYKIIDSHPNLSLPTGKMPRLHGEWRVRVDDKIQFVAREATLAVDGREHPHDTDINRVVAPNEFVVAEILKNSEPPLLLSCVFATICIVDERRTHVPACEQRVGARNRFKMKIGDRQE